MSSKTLNIVAIGVGSTSFGRGVLADVLGTPELNRLDCTLTLVDIDQTALDRMFRAAEIMRDHFGSSVKLRYTTDRTQALPGADYVIVSVAVRRYPLWEQDFRVPLALGFRHVLGENGGPGAIFHALRSFELVLPICRDMERLCPNALLLNYTNPEARVVMAVSQMTSVRAVGLCHGVFAARSGVSEILDRPLEGLDIRAGGLNHFFWVTGVRDAATGEDLYPLLRKRILTDPDCPKAPPLVRRMVEAFGCYTYPSDDHIGEYLSFAHEFTGLKWHYGQESRPVPRKDDAAELWLNEYLDGRRSPDDRLVRSSGELAIPIILDIEMDRGCWRAAVNVPNTGGYIENLPDDAVVEVAARVDAAGVHPEHLGALPEGLAAFCATQVSIQKLLVQAYAERSRNLLLQALLLDPVVDSVSRAERLLDDMLGLQKDYVGHFH